MSVGVRAEPSQGPPMLPGNAESYGRFVQVTSAAMPRNLAPSSKLTFDPSLTRLMAAAAARSASRYDDPANWPDVFNPGSSADPGAAPTGGSGGGGSPSLPASPSLPSVPSVPGSPSANPSGNAEAGGGPSVPLPVLPAGDGTGSSTPSVTPESPLPVAPPAIPPAPTLPAAPVVISAPLVDAPVGVVLVPEGGMTVLLLGVSLLVCAALRKRLSWS